MARCLQVRHFVGSFALLASAACVSVTEPDWIVQPGQIGGGGVEAYVVTGPDTVTAGIPFVVIVQTFGSSSCTRAAGADVTLSSLTATIVPLDSVPYRRDAICTMDLRAFPRNVSVTLRPAGPGTVAVAGRGAHGDTTITHRVVVR
jgi:hypothetical protein